MEFLFNMIMFLHVGAHYMRVCVYRSNYKYLHVLWVS